MVAGAEGTSAYHRSRGRPVTRQGGGVADQVLREIRSRGPSEEDECRSNRRLSCDEIDFILEAVALTCESAWKIMPKYR